MESPLKHFAEMQDPRLPRTRRHLLTEIGWLQKQHQWPGLKAIGKVERIRETAAKNTTETAYYLLSSELTPERFNEVVRQHWSIENSLHWRLDVVMNEDQDRTRAGNGAQNLAGLRHMVMNARQKEGSKGSLRGKFKRACWDDRFFFRLLEMFWNAFASPHVAGPTHIKLPVISAGRDGSMRL